MGAEYTLDGGMLHLSVTADTTEISIDFALPYHAEVPVGEHNEKDGVYAIFRGNAMYSVTTDEALAISHDALIAGAEGYTLRPLFDAYETDHAPRQVLFS